MKKEYLFNGVWLRHKKTGKIARVKFISWDDRIYVVFEDKEKGIDEDALRNNIKHLRSKRVALKDLEDYYLPGLEKLEEEE